MPTLLAWREQTSKPGPGTLIVLPSGLPRHMGHILHTSSKKEYVHKLFLFFLSSIFFTFLLAPKNGQKPDDLRHHAKEKPSLRRKLLGRNAPGSKWKRRGCFSILEFRNAHFAAFAPSVGSAVPFRSACKGGV